MIEMTEAIRTFTATTAAPRPTLAERIEASLTDLHYGTVVLTVHDGRVVQIDTTRRERLTG